MPCDTSIDVTKSFQGHPALVFSADYSQKSGAPVHNKGKSRQMERFLKTSLP